MTDQQNRPQTLLEAAKAVLLSHSDGSDWGRIHLAGHNLREAIAREEAKQAAVESTAPFVMWMDRAQQAEASAAWLSLECNKLDRMVSEHRQRADRAEGEVLHLTRCNDDLGKVTVAERQRAEKAEAAYSDRDRQYRTLRTESARWQARAEFAEGMIARALGGKS